MIAIKAHIGGAMDTPEKAEWLRARVGSERIKFNYDYSHFGLQGIPLEPSVRLMMPNTVFVHVKD
jgi:sugar phosphate isomerase/epimerase